MKNSERFGPVPDDLPVEELEAIHGELSEGDDALYVVDRELWMEWAGACNGIRYRLAEVADTSDAWGASVAKSDAPEIEERIRQERHLFDFFSSATSVVDCVAYGLCAIGQFLRPEAFPLTANPRAMTFSFAASTYAHQFPDAELTDMLKRVGDSDELGELREIRNTLTHRAAPGRNISLSIGSEAGRSSTWLTRSLEPELTQVLRDWLSPTVGEILAAAHNLLRQELPPRT